MAMNGPCPSCSTPLPAEARFCLNCGLDVTDPSGSSPTLLTDASAAHLEEMLQKETRGEFEIERELGRGGMAVVFLARETLLDRRVAIKVLPPELTFGRGATDRFRREARMAAGLDHPNIIPIYRVSSQGQLFWYAMKWIEGETLQDLLARKAPLALDETVGLLEQIADALDYAHGRKIIHRDMKPSNVLLDGSGRVTVTDFGIAKPLGATSMTLSGAMMGTPQFMAPEQCTGGEVTGAVDQYALGVMTYQMLSGRVLFKAESPVEVLHKHCYVEPPALEALRPELPPEVCQAVHRTLAKEPSKRFRTVSDFVAKLKFEREKADLTRVTATSTTPIDGSEILARVTEPTTGRSPPRPVARMRFIVAMGVVITTAIGAEIFPHLAPRVGRDLTTPSAGSSVIGTTEVDTGGEMSERLLGSWDLRIDTAFYARGHPSLSAAVPSSTDLRLFRDWKMDLTIEPLLDGSYRADLQDLDDPESWSIEIVMDDQGFYGWKPRPNRYPILIQGTVGEDGRLRGAIGIVSNYEEPPMRRLSEEELLRLDEDMNFFIGFKPAAHAGAGDEPVLQAQDLLGRGVAGEHDLLLSVVEGVEGVEEWHQALDETLGNWELTEYTSPHCGGSPEDPHARSTVEGDFNGNGVADRAVWLKTESSTRLVIMLRTNDGWELHTVYQEEGRSRGAFLVVIPKDETIREWTSTGDRPQFTIPFATVALVYCEKSAVAFVLQDGQFREVWLSD